MLTIPAVVGLGAAWFTVQQGKESDRENTDNQRETALQAYIDKMSELLLHENLRDSKPEYEVRKIARVRTLTVLSRLNKVRKWSVLQFLYESDLINKSSLFNKSGLLDEDQPIIDLNGADLSGAILSYVSLTGVRLSGANLSHAQLMDADLSGADLSDADLSDTDLRKANLTGAKASAEQLKQAKSLKGATMPDGSIHE